MKHAATLVGVSYRPTANVLTTLREKKKKKTDQSIR